MAAILRVTRVIWIAAVLPACTGVDAVRTSWYGQPAEALIRSWGPPAEIWDQEDGGRLLIYRDKDPHIVYDGGGRTNALFTFRCVVSFKTDRAGIIVSSSTESSIAGCERLLRERPAAGQRLAAPPSDLRVRPEGER